MKVIQSKISSYMLAILLIACALSSSALAQIVDVTFGSNNDGAGGFTPSGTSGTEVWTVEADSYNYTFGSTDNPTASGNGPNDEGNTASLLRQLTLDTSAGSSYTFEAVVDLTDGYGDDNNRIGVLLFNQNASQTSDGGGGIYLVLNTDNTSDVGIRSGINGTNLDIGSHTVNPGDGWIGDTLTFSGTIDYTATDIDLAFTVTGATNGAFGAFSTSVDKTVYNGTYFGFANKWRSRNTLDSDRNAVADFDYQSFSIIPEPSTLMLVAVGLVAGVGIRSRRRR